MERQQIEPQSDQHAGERQTILERFNDTWIVSMARSALLDICSPDATCWMLTARGACLPKRSTEEFSAASRHRTYDRVCDVVPEFRPDIYFNWLPDSLIGTRHAGALEIEPMRVISDKATAIDIMNWLPLRRG